MSMATLLPLTETPDAKQIFSVSFMALWLQIARRLGKSRFHAFCKLGACSGLRAWNANVALSLRLAQTWNIKGGGSGETPQELRRPPRQNQSGPSERKAIVSHWRAGSLRDPAQPCGRETASVLREMRRSVHSSTSGGKAHGQPIGAIGNTTLGHRRAS